MKLPNADQAIVDREKIIQYLLNPEHRSGASKARFFRGFGFELSRWELLAEAFREHARLYEVSRVTDTLFGRRYELSGNLRSPDGRTPMLMSVWQLDHGKVAPRLITAYPLRETGASSHD